MYNLFIYFMYIALPAIVLFLGLKLGVLGAIAALSCTICWIPFESYSRPEGCNEYNNTNPLYVRGLLRKNPSKNNILCNLKGIYYCQIMSASLLVCAFVYLGYFYLYGFQWWYYRLEITLAICFIGLLLIRLFLQVYYLWCYNTDYRYAQNKNGIWMPFNFVFKALNRIQNPFSCNYHVNYEKIQENLKESCKEKGYNFTERYITDDGSELIFFTKHTLGRLDVFSLIHVDKLEVEHWDKFNGIFEIYWKDYVKERYTFDEARFTFLLCVEKRCKQLKKMGIRYGIDQKKGRFRLPAVLSYYDNDTLTINQNYSGVRGSEQYNEMRKELLSMLGISGRYNNKVYPEEYEG
ncbi:hypothetical protein NXH76_21980 [Blautia schinkii]|nr:hypothetical protein [Blautia schinkii]